MSQELDNVLRKSLDEVDRSQKRQVIGFVIFLALFLVHAYGFILSVHGGGAASAMPSRHLLGVGLLTVVFTIAFCTFGITLFISRMTKKVLRAIELSSKP
jgi:predicted membrane protein